MGDILALAARYRDEGADELVFYDITASPEGRSVDRSWIDRIGRLLDIPFCVAGGIRSVEDAESVLGLGAEKISVNSPALADPALVDRLAARIGDFSIAALRDRRSRIEARDSTKAAPVERAVREGLPVMPLGRDRRKGARK